MQGVAGRLGEQVHGLVVGWRGMHGVANIIIIIITIRSDIRPCELPSHPWCLIRMLFGVSGRARCCCQGCTELNFIWVIECAVHNYIRLIQLCGVFIKAPYF